MSPTPRQFQFTVGIALALQLMLLGLNHFGLLPEPTGSADGLAWNSFGSALKPKYLYATWWVWYVVHIGSLIGLVVLWRPARYFATVALIIGILESGWSGIRVSAPFEGFFSQVSFVFYLLGLGMAYYAPSVNCLFGAPPEVANDGT